MLPISKLVAIDLDGTLIQSDGSIPSSLIQIIKNLSLRGIKFTIATGRMTEAAEKYAKLIGGALTISYNGSVVKRTDGTYTKKMIPPNSTKTMIEFCNVNELYLQIYHNGKIYARGKPNHLKSDPDSKIVESQIVSNFTNIKIHPTPKMVIVSDTKETLNLIRKNENIFHDLCFSQSSANVIEITPKGVDKKYGLSIIADELNINKSDIMAIGDGMNDLSMIEWAGTGIAVANAPEELKSKADVISSKISSIGVQEILEDLF